MEEWEWSGRLFKRIQVRFNAVTRDITGTNQITANSLPHLLMPS